MEIVGGSYQEICHRPQWNRIFGSGGRAVAAIAGLSNETDTFHTFANPEWNGQLHSAAQALGYRISVTEIPEKISWEYLYPGAKPQRFPLKISRAQPIHLEGDAILRYNMVEGEAIVDGDRVVYDPQSAEEPIPFDKNGSRAKHLAVVMNEYELAELGCPSEDASITRLFDEWGAEVVVLKLGPYGAKVFNRSLTYEHVLCFPTDNVFKIGSGDVFSAVFANFWAREKRDPAEAATLASKAVAAYVKTRALPITERHIDSIGDGKLIEQNTKRVYLAGPFFNTAQLWLVDEILRRLENFSIDVFSPFHDVGLNGNGKNVAVEDLAGLEGCDLVLAIIDGNDPGTCFEVGYARQKGIPVIALCERVPEFEQTMFVGTDCQIHGDLMTALYACAWM